MSLCFPGRAILMLSALIVVPATAYTGEPSILTASDATNGDHFGYSASLFASTAVVGAHVADGVTPGSGAVYVFLRTGMSWTQQAKLMASDGLGETALEKTSSYRKTPSSSEHPRTVTAAAPRARPTCSCAVARAGASRRS